MTGCTREAAAAQPWDQAMIGGAWVTGRTGGSDRRRQGGTADPHSGAGGGGFPAGISHALVTPGARGRQLCTECVGSARSQSGQ
jgi:hypothetical protein